MRKNDEFVTIGDIVEYAKHNTINDDTPIFINIGQGDGTFLRRKATGNYKGENGVFYDEGAIEGGVLELRLSPSCTKWIEIGALYPIKLTNNKIK